MKKYLVMVGIILIGLMPNCCCFGETLQISSDAKIYYNQGIDYYKMREYDKSMEAFRKAIDADANYVDAYYNLASILEYLRQDEEALAIFKKIIVRSPDDYDAIYRAAELSVRLGNTEQAKSYLTLIPQNSSAYQKASNLAYSLGADLQTIKEEKKSEAKQSETPQTSGIYSQIESPTGIVMGTDGNLYVASFSENVIYKITPDNKKIIIVKDARISGPIGLALDSENNIFVANYNKDNILKISPSGQISVVLANVQKPYIVFIKDNMLYISSQGSNSVVRYKLN